MQSKELWEIMVILKKWGLKFKGKIGWKQQPARRGFISTLTTQYPVEVTADVFHGYVEALFKGLGTGGGLGLSKYNSDWLARMRSEWEQRLRKRGHAKTVPVQTEIKEIKSIFRRQNLLTQLCIASHWKSVVLGKRGSSSDGWGCLFNLPSFKSSCHIHPSTLVH